MSVVPFDWRRRFARPCAVLWSPGRKTTGETLWFIDYLPFESLGGGHFGLWSGTDYGTALAELDALKHQGEAVHEIGGGA